MPGDAFAAGFFCCSEGAIPLAEIHTRLYAQAEAFARAAGMRGPTVYARWALRQCGFDPFPLTTDAAPIAAHAGGQSNQQSDPQQKSS